MKKKLFYFLLLFSCNIYAQNTANKLFENFDYAAAIPHFEEYLNSKEDQQATERLAECYRLTNKLDRAEKWYAKLMKFENKEPIYTLYYAQVLQANGNCNLAIEFAKKYDEAMPNDTRGKAVMKACDNEQKLGANAVVFEVKNAPLNSPNDDFGAVIYNNGIVFCSDRSNNKKNNDWTNRPFSDVYYAAKKSEDYYTIPVKLNGDFKSKNHVGPLAFNSQGTIAYVTRSDKTTGKKEDISWPQLYKATMHDGSWEKLEKLPFVKEDYGYAFAALSPDDEYLYFVSNMPGGYGGTDIYRVGIEGETFDEVENLGPTINTTGDEKFPFINIDGTLYFASNGHSGLGGLDIFSAKSIGKTWATPENLAAPINSNKDDFALIWSDDQVSGYFTSSRTGGNGGDDIYTFKKTAILCTGYVYDSKTNTPIDASQITIFKDGEVIDNILSNADGRFKIAMKEDAMYKIQAAKENYILNYKNVNTASGEKNYDVQLPLISKEKLEATNQSLVFKIEGTIRDKKTSLPISNSKVKITDKCSRKDYVIETDNNGIYKFDLTNGCEYEVSAQKEYYFTNTNYASTVGYNTSQTFRKDIELDPFEINKAIRVENIYYDVNKWNIRPDAAYELDKLVKIMRDNPGIKIELGSHTDCRASDEYNMDLSSKRATSSVQYIISRGIAGNRLSAVGYGESQLINQCANGINCPDNEHQQNRRTEIKVTSYDANLQTSDFVSSSPQVIVKNDVKNTTTPNQSVSNTQSTTNITTPKQEVIPTGELFKIQVKIVQEYASSNFAALQDLATLSTESTGSSFSRVLIGDFATLNDAKKILKYVKERGYPDAYIVGYNEGKRGRIY
jgi:outer membrane protein OmpA-like peptidoglycan-associated protein